MMGLNKLGKNQSKVFSLDIELFKKQFLDLLQDLDFIDEKTCFESIHKAFDFAYSPQTQTNSRNKKIVYNFFKPNLYNFIKFVSKFPESKTLYLVQNPIQLLESFINEGFKNIKGQEVKKDIKILSKICNEIIQTLVNSNHPLNKICNTQGIKLEDVINSPKKILPKIAKWMNINDLPEMYDSKFLDHQFLNQSKKEALLNLSNDKKETKPISSLFGTRDKKIIETLLWPMMSAFKYTTLKENQFKKNMTEIRPWLDEPFQFEQRYYTKITNKTKSLKDMDSYKALHKHLIKHWEILNQNNKHHNVVSQIIQ